MNRISSEYTFFAKQIVPIGLGVLAVVLGHAFFFGPHSGPLTWLMILTAPLNLLFGYFLARWQVWGLADEVFDEGDALLVIKGSREERIALSNIERIRRESHLRLPDTVTVVLKAPSSFGQEISFFQRMQIPFAKNSPIQDLINRVETQRPG